MLDPPQPPGLRPPPAPTSRPRRRRSTKTDIVLVGVALSAVLCGAAVLTLRSHHSSPIAAIESTTLATTKVTPDATVGSASTLAPVELTSTTNTAVLVGTASPGAVVLVLGHQAVADATGNWRITVDLVPGVNHFQAVATEPSGLQVATNFTVVYTPSGSASVPTSSTSAAPNVSNATTTVAVNTPVAISSPLDGAVVTTAQITMSGTAAPGARVNAAGTLVTAAKNGLWSAFVTLKPGANRVTVTATTPAEVTTVSINVRYTPPGPRTTTTPPSTIPVDTEPPPP
jgi:hypothetical protein